MPRRRNDPLGFTTAPNLVVDAARKAVIVAEVTRRFRFLARSYRLEKQLMLNSTGYNASLDQLRKAVRSRPDPTVAQRRLRPWLEFAINRKARELAGIAPDAMLTIEHNVFVAQAVAEVAANAKAIRVTPGLKLMSRYVEGAMAVIQEATGKPVMGPRDNCSTYDPYLRGLNGRTLRTFVDDLEPGVTDTKLAYWVREARKKYADKSMAFLDMFPGYGAAVDPESGEPVVLPPHRVEAFSLNAPIYCPSR